MRESGHCPSCDQPLDPETGVCPTCGHAPDAYAPTEPSDPPVGKQSTEQQEERLRDLLRDALAPDLLLIRELGRGGMGTVYLAREPALKRLVAVKVLAPELAKDPKARRRFEREAQSAAAIAHPNVVSVHGVGVLADETPYFVMGYVNGPSLEERLKREGPLEIEEARRVLGQVASALESAHRLGIIHRDIKPGNILYDEDAGHVLVSDFGISSILESEETGEITTLTETGTVIGTPAYMSPEQLLAEEVTERSDIYSLGVVAYQLLAGQGPFEVRSARELVAAILRDTPRKLSELRPDVDPELEALIEGCLARNPDDRPLAGAIARRLTSGAGVLLEWPPPGLEGLHGRVWRLAGAAAVGSVLLVSPIVALLAGVRLRVNWTLGFVSTLGFLVVLGTIGWLLWLTWRAATASRMGYGAFTIAEVLADRRRDTGALIAGTREYVRLEVGLRSLLRAGRVVRAALVSMAAFWPPVGLAFTAFLGSRELVSTSALWVVVIVVPALLLLAALLIANVELRHVERTRREIRRRRSRADSAIRLVEPWNASFQAARSGQALGGGAPGRHRLVALMAVGLAVIVFGALSVALPLSLASQFARAAWPEMLPRFEGVQESLDYARVAAAYRLPSDPTLSDLEAGRALHSIYVAGRHPHELMFYEKSPKPVLVPDWLDAWYAADNPFQEDRRRPQPSLLARAAAGLSPEETALLRRIADDPVFNQFSIAAGTREADVLAAWFEIPFPRTASYPWLPIPKFASTIDAAHAHTAKAAFELADGRPDDAERTLRTAISVGLLMAEEGTTLIESLIGAGVANIGRSALVELFRVTGREEEARRITAAVDSLQAIRETAAASLPGVPAEDNPLSVLEESDDIQRIRDRLAALAADSTRLRSLRWELMQSLAFAPCTNALEIVFGPSAEHRRHMAAIREGLVRRESDAALFQLIEETLERPLPLEVSTSAEAILAIGSAVGGKRLRSCAALAEWLGGHGHN